MYSVVLLLSSVLGLVSGQKAGLARSNPTETNDLVLACLLSRSASLRTDGLLSMQLSKNTSSGNSNNIVSITSGSDDYNWQDTSMENRDGVSVTGLNTKGNIQIATLTLTIDRYNTTCQDAGVYFCVVTAFYTDSSLFVGTSTATVEITSKPTYTDLTVSMSNSQGLSLYQYKVGMTLNFTCTGTVGTDKVDHRWCYQRQGTTLTDYPYPSAINQNNDGVSTYNVCNNRRTSYLTYNVSNEDRSTVIMCEPNIGIFCNSSGLAKYITIRNYVPTVVSFVPSDSSYRLTEGQSIPTITCTANCIPECTYYWYKDGHPYLTGTDLRLTDVQRKAEGVYRCIASNAYGNYTSNSVTVIVICPFVTVCDPSIQTTGVALICTSVVVLLITLAFRVVMTRKHQLLCVRCRNQKESVTTTQGDIARTYDHLDMDRIEKPSVYSQLDKGKDNTLGESNKYENYTGSTDEYETPVEANRK